MLITSCSSELEKSLIIDKIPDDPVLTISIKEFENVNFQTLEFISESVDFDFSSIENYSCLLYTSPSPRDIPLSRMPSSA